MLKPQHEKLVHPIGWLKAIQYYAGWHYTKFKAPPKNAQTYAAYDAPRKHAQELTEIIEKKLNK